MRRLVVAGGVALSLIVAGPAPAEQLGAIGPVFPIAEKDGVEEIKDRFRDAQKSGALQKAMQSYQQRALQDMAHPPPVPGIVTGYDHHVRGIDPTYTFQSDVKDPLGKVMIAAGTRVNPLQGLSLANEYLFIDARDFDQIRIAQKFVDSDPVRHRVVLVAGDYNQMADKLGVRVYFDQKGRLSEALRIRQVPARVYQKDALIMVEEGGRP